MSSSYFTVFWCLLYTNQDVIRYLPLYIVEQYCKWFMFTVQYSKLKNIYKYLNICPSLFSLKHNNYNSKISGVNCLDSFQKKSNEISKLYYVKIFFYVPMQYLYLIKVNNGKTIHNQSKNDPKTIQKRSKSDPITIVTLRQFLNCVINSFCIAL